jgi:putative cell wall binding repeat protein
VSRERPINADLPPATGTSAAPPPPSRPRRPRKCSRRQPIPGALKLIGATVAIAVAFLVAAIVGGSGSKDEEPATGTPAPVATRDGDDEPLAAQTAEELGYPGFATNNTTRIGGSDPASNAAAVALAVYPSTDPAQRPDAVTLLDGESWQSAVAAAVLMAAPVRAPLLLSGDEVPEPTEEALAALSPQGSGKTHGAQAFVVGGTASSDGLRTTQVGTGGPVASAAAIAALRERLLGAPPAHFVVVSVAEPGFAVPAAAWAARSGDPVLFARKDELPGPTAAALRRHPDAPVYVLGPSSAISSSVVREISKVAGEVHRVSGEDPVTNAIALARYADGDFGWNVNDPGHGFVIARSGSPLDAAVAAPLSASGTWGPLLLTDSADTLPAALRDYLLDIKPGYTTDPTRAFYNHVWLIGDEEAINVDQQGEIDGLAEVAKIRGES